MGTVMAALLLADRVNMRIVLGTQGVPREPVKSENRKARVVCISAVIAGFRIWGAVTAGEEWTRGGDLCERKSAGERGRDVGVCRLF